MLVSRAAYRIAVRRTSTRLSAVAGFAAVVSAGLAVTVSTAGSPAAVMRVIGHHTGGLSECRVLMICLRDADDANRSGAASSGIQQIEPPAGLLRQAV